jgi:anti-sigma B factor antagonist
MTSTQGEIGLLVDVVDGEGMPVLRLAGELDMQGTMKLLEHGMRVLAKHDAGSVVTIDLTDLNFCDSCGLRALYQLQQHAAALDEILVLRSPRRIVRRVLELTGMTELFTVLPSAS